MIDLKNFERINKISSKKCYKVYEVVNMRTKMKYIAKTTYHNITQYTIDQITEFCQDIKINSKLNHPSIINFIGYSNTDFKKRQNPVFIVEYAPQGKLSTITQSIRKNDLILGWNDTKKLITIYGIASSMSYLHSHNIIHRQLEPNSICIDKNFYPKLCNFGLSQEISDKTIKTSSKTSKSYEYLAPEVLYSLEYSKKSDVYAFSILVYEIMTNSKPFSNLKNISDFFKAVYEEGLRPTIDESIPECYRQLIKKCWSNKTSERPSFDQIVSILRTNSDFTENVDVEEYHKYIEYLDNYPTSFAQTNEIPQLNDLIESNRYHFQVSDIDEELRNLKVDTNINLKNYIQRDLYYKGRFYEVFQIYQNSSRFGAKIPSHDLSHFLKHEITNFSQELSIMCKLNYPSIVKLIGYSPVDFQNNPKPTIVVEYPSSKTLNNIHSFYPKEWNDTKKLINLYGIASAMSYLHEHNIIHRDLKPQNISLDKNKYPKINGFNICREVDDTGKKKSHKLKGTPAYLSPETYLKHEYSKSSDVYSYSLIMYEIITNEKPYQEYHSCKEIIQKITKLEERPKINIPIPKCYRELIERCWSSNPDDRPTFEEIKIILKNDQRFMTENIDYKEYESYIKYIEEYPITFNSDQRIPHLDDIVKSRIHTICKANPEFNFGSIYSTEKNDISLHYEFVNLEKFEKGNLIDDDILFKYFEAFDKKTRQQYKLRMLSDRFTNFCKHDITNYTNELNILLQVNHPSIIKFCGYSPVDFKNDPFPVVITEYASKDTLETILDCERKEHSKEWNDTKKLINLYGIASAMSYLHEHNIIHRDLKPQNISLDKNKYPKINGFNICREVDDTGKKKSHKVKGTPAYLSPETYLKHEYSKSSDVYSYSLIMYEIITNEKPYQEYHSCKEIIQKITKSEERPKINIPIPKCYRELIERCWSSNPDDRPTFEEIKIILKNDQRFITENIDYKEYESYIKYIDEYPITFNSDQRIRQCKTFIKSKSSQFPIFETNFDFKNIYDTEQNNLLFDPEPLNINEYEKQKKIESNGLSSDFLMRNKVDNKLYMGSSNQISINKTFKPFILLFTRYLLLIPKLHHPSINQYIGHSITNRKGKNKLITIHDYAPNGRLSNILNLEREGIQFPGWNDTKKLINIYGIASAMQYLHSNDIIHCSLEPINILLDDYLFPKLSGFLFSKIESEKPISKLYQKPSNYDSPNVLCSCYRKKCDDVYAFSMIVYEIITKEKPSEKDITAYQAASIEYEDTLFDPIFPNEIPNCYRELIKQGTAEEESERPTFDEIVTMLKTNPDFITDKINKDEYFKYINFIDESPIGFNSGKMIPISINNKFNKISIDFSQIKNKQKPHFSINIKSIDLNKFDKLNQIGKGGFGKVYKVFNKETNEIDAAKISIYEIDLCTIDKITNLSREIDIISRLNHPSILQFIGYNPNNFKSKPKPIIITEYAMNGSLDTIIELERMNCGIPDWNDTKKLIVIYGIASGMKYLHEHNIIHRDLKPANIFLDEYLYPKIGDFGLSKEVINDNQKEIQPSPSGYKGTYAYSAPEVFKGIYTKACDVYAFSMIMFEILTNEILFKGCNQFQLLNKIREGYRPKFPYIIPYNYKKLIEKCWSENPKERPTFDTIVYSLKKNSGFITENVDKEEYLNYISYIEDIDIYNDYQQEIEQESENIELNKVEIKSNRVIEEEEIDNSIKERFLNLNQFEKHELLIKDDFSKVYVIRNKKNKDKFAAKIFMFNNYHLSRDQVISLSDEVNKISHLNHPSFLKFVGLSLTDFKNDSNPVIVTELAANRTLHQMLEMERKNCSFSGWNDTKKIINIYGIAAGMSYLHSNNIIYCDLKPENIFLDDFLFPKIGDFGISSKFHNERSMTYESLSGLKGTPTYSAPEILQNNYYSKSGDVYAFSFIMYEILTNEIPFKEFTNTNQIFDEVVVNENRPAFKKKILDAHKNLIERCWSQNPDERPSFESIVNELKMNSEFIPKRANQTEYQNYIKMIEKSQISFDQAIIENNN